MKSHKDQKAWNLISKSRSGPKSMKSHTQIITSSLPTQPPTEPFNHTIAWLRQVILHYTYWLTKIHIGNFRDIPLIHVSVEGGSRMKHCRKKRRPITFTVNAEEKEGGRTLIKILWQPEVGKRSAYFIHHSTNPNPRVNLLESTWCNACWWHASDNFHSNPSFFQRNRTFTNHHHPTCIHPPPTNHRAHSISRILQHQPLHRPYITPSKRKFGSQKAWNLTKKQARNDPKMHKISSGYLVRKLRSKKHKPLKDISHNGQIAWNLISKSHKKIVQQKAWNLMKKSYNNGQTSMKSHQEISSRPKKRDAPSQHIPSPPFSRTHSHACLYITSSPPSWTPDQTLEPLEHEFTSRPARHSQNYVSTY